MNNLLHAAILIERAKKHSYQLSDDVFAGLLFVDAAQSIILDENGKSSSVAPHFESGCCLDVNKDDKIVAMYPTDYKDTFFLQRPTNFTRFDNFSKKLINLLGFSNEFIEGYREHLQQDSLERNLTEGEAKCFIDEDTSQQKEYGRQFIAGYAIYPNGQKVNLVTFRKCIEICRYIFADYANCKLNKNFNWEELEKRLHIIAKEKFQGNFSLMESNVKEYVVCHNLFQEGFNLEQNMEVLLENGFVTSKKEVIQKFEELYNDLIG